MATRKKKDSTKVLTCKGGPYDGHAVRLSGDAVSATAVFTAKGQTGSYHAREGTTITQWVPQ